MIQKLLVLSLAFCSFAAVNPSNTQGVEDPAELPTTIQVEPKYTGDKPLYAMAVFGEKYEKVFWMVLDKTEPDSKVYNKLFVDLNCNGDLTEPTELFSLLDDDGKNRKSIDLPDVIVSNESEFTKVTVLIRKAAKGECMFETLWNDKIRFGGGYPQGTEDGDMCFADKQSEAPIVFFKGNAPFEFQPWIPQPLTIGSRTNFDVILGHRGKGYSSFCSSLGHILAEKEPVLTRLNYVDNKGRKKSLDGKLSNRC